MTALVFRKAVSTDLTAIMALIADDDLARRRGNPTDPANKAYVGAFAAMDADPNQMMAVAELDGKLVGYMQITFIPGLSRGGIWRGQLESVRVASHMRGQGIGTRFFQWAIDQCRERGCGLVQLTTDRQRDDSVRFYERLGFEASHHGMKLIF